VNISDTLDQLRALQKVDTRIRALERELENLPQELEAAREDLAAVEAKRDQARKAKEEVELRRRALEQDIDTCDANIRRSETTKLKVKTNEEYRALNNEIDHELEKKSGLEDLVLASYDEEAEISARLKKLKGEAAMVAQGVEEKEKAVQDRMEADRREVAELREHRAKIVPGIDAPILRRYEGIRAGKSGTAVVTLIRGSCGGCFTQIPPQQAAEVKKRNSLQTCELCGRYLVWDEVEATAS